MEKELESSGTMGIDMGDGTNMAVAVMSRGELVFCQSFDQYEDFNRAVQELQKTYSIPNNKIFYEND
jgi:hypothetical protein